MRVACPAAGDPCYPFRDSNLANGAPRLREVIAPRSAARRVDVAPAGILVTAPARILVTAGAQQGLSLVTECLVNPGEVVAIETSYYTGALAALRNRAARLTDPRN